MQDDTNSNADAGRVDRRVRPRAWLLEGTQCVEFDRQKYHDSQEWEPLYDQAALDAALNLWPRDCRTCAHFRDGLTHSAHCVSVLRCEDSSRYRPTQPVQMWERAPSGAPQF